MGNQWTVILLKENSCINLYTTLYDLYRHIAQRLHWILKLACIVEYKLEIRKYSKHFIFNGLWDILF